MYKKSLPLSGVENHPSLALPKIKPILERGLAASLSIRRMGRVREGWGKLKLPKRSAEASLVITGDGGAHILFISKEQLDLRSMAGEGALPDLGCLFRYDL